MAMFNPIAITSQCRSKLCIQHVKIILTEFRSVLYNIDNESVRKLKLYYVVFINSLAVFYKISVIFYNKLLNEKLNLRSSFWYRKCMSWFITIFIDVNNNKM